MPKFKLGDIVVCVDCGKTTLRSGATQRYCKTCSSKRDISRKQKWSKENPKQSGYDGEQYKLRQATFKGIGAEASESNRVGIDWLTNSFPEEEMTRTARVVLPFTSKFSKNALWNISAKGHVYQRQEIKDAHDFVVGAIRRNNLEWFDGKVWIDIFVMKPNAMSDAINVIDLICDAVKKAIEVDDRWFCIRRLDWSIVKKNPSVIIGVSQSVTEHHRCCSYCGGIKPLGEFQKNKGGPRGHGRECKECIKLARIKKKAGRSA